MNYSKGGIYAERSESFPPARFLLLPIKDKQASIEAGHEVYVDKPFIEILKQGGDIQQFAVNDEFKTRYAQKWDAFEQGLTEPKTGLPLEKWPGCTRAECETLKGVNLFTVEELAAATDLALDRYGIGARPLKNKAIKYIEAAKDNGAVIAKLEELEKKMELLVNKNSELEGELRNADIANQTLKAQLPEVEVKRKPGRPKKE